MPSGDLIKKYAITDVDTKQTTFDAVFRNRKIFCKILCWNTYFADMKMQTCIY